MRALAYHRHPKLNVPCGIAAVVLIAATCFLVYSVDPYRREMRRVHAVIDAGKQNWGSDASELLDGIIARSANRHVLAERLMREKDGSLVAEGMLLAVRAHHPQARHLIEQHVNDVRWNWYLTSDDDLAKQLLLYIDGKPTEEWVLSCLAKRSTDAPTR